MGLMNKLKDILFETEGEEESTKKNKKNRKEEQVFVENSKEPAIFDEPIKLEPKQEVVVEQKKEVEYKTETKFTFPDFDESEFESSRPKRIQTPIIDNYKPKEIKEIKNESRLNKVTKGITTDNRKFKLSPVISPVYGILDKNYKPDDIKETSTPNIGSRLNVDSVRKKAFGKLDSDIEKTTFNIQMPVKNDDLKEKIKTIDELLMDSASEEIEVDNASKTKRININDIEKELNGDDNEELDIDLNSYLNEHTDDKEKEDTLESDLFDLIDSMYENRKSGE